MTAKGVALVARLACGELIGVAGGRSEKDLRLLPTLGGAGLVCLALGAGIAFALAEVTGPMGVADAAVVLRLAAVLAGVTGFLVLYLLGVSRLGRLALNLGPLPASRALRATAHGLPVVLVLLGSAVLFAPAVVVLLHLAFGLGVVRAMGLASTASAVGVLGATVVQAVASRVLRGRTQVLRKPVVWTAWALIVALAVESLAGASGQAGALADVLTLPLVGAGGVVVALLVLLLALGGRPQADVGARARLVLPAWRGRGPVPLLVLQVRQAARDRALRGVLLQCTVLTAVLVVGLAVVAPELRPSLGSQATLLLAVCWTHPVLSVARRVTRTPAGCLLLSEQGWRARAYVCMVALSGVGAVASAAFLERVVPGESLAKDTVLFWLAALGLSAVAGLLTARSSTEAVDTASLTAVYVVLYGSALLLATMSGGQADVVPVLLAVLGTTLLALVVAGRLTGLRRPAAISSAVPG